jgi:CBS domain-containing protein
MEPAIDRPPDEVRGLRMIEEDGLDALDEAACRWLLAQEHVGRLALSSAGAPVVFPVNYAVGGDDVLFFTGEGTKLSAAVAAGVAAFEIDHVDAWNRTGWSVVATGRLREVVEPVVVAGARAAGLRPWAEGDRPHLVALQVERLTGRRIVAPIDLRDHRVGAMPATPRSPVSAVAHPPVRIAARSTLRDAADAMRDANVSSVLVDPDDAIVTEHDITRALHAGMGPDSDVARVSVSDFVAVDIDATVVEAAGQMLRHEIRHLVVCNHRGEVVGLVSLRDIVGVLVDAMDPAVWVMLRETLSVRSM